MTAQQALIHSLKEDKALLYDASVSKSLVIDILQWDIEELELFKSEHLRLEAELNAILHLNGDGPIAPSFCDLVAYVRADLQPKSCNTCAFDHCGCSVQDSLLRYDPNATFEAFWCTAHEAQS